jgi:CheY-like chemotaxis protein
VQPLKLVKYSSGTNQGFTLFYHQSFKPIFTIHKIQLLYLKNLEHKKLNIFLADDDDDDRDFFRTALKKLDSDCELTMLNNGQKVIEHFSALTNLPDYVFLDINMPLADGIECLNYIRKTHPEHKFPIIMLSTANSEEMIKRCYKAGASMYVRKPNRFSQLVDILRFCIHDIKAQIPRQEFVLDLR